MTFTDLLVASTPIILLIVCLAWRGIPTLIEWRRERKYQVEWHRTFRDESAIEVRLRAWESAGGYRPNGIIRCA